MNANVIPCDTPIPLHLKGGARITGKHLKLHKKIVGKGLGEKVTTYPIRLGWTRFLRNVKDSDENKNSDKNSEYWWVRNSITQYFNFKQNLSFRK